VPLDRDHTVADLIAALGLPLVLVAPNALGVLSHALTAAESAERRNLHVAALVLTDLTPTTDLSDPSRPHNAAILRERLPFPVLPFPYCAETSDAALGRAAISAKLLSLI
jgi:dethiobiotin synthetase